MKRFFLMAGMLILTLVSQAQNLNKCKDQLTKNQLDQAKTCIDEFLANPKNQKNTEAWLVKASVYNGVAANDQFKSLAPNGRMEAFEAIKKAMEIDPKQANLQLTLVQYKPIYELYAGYFDLAAAQYNAEKFDDAFTNFSNAGAVGQYIFSNQWGLYALDTTLIYYQALSAMNAKKDDVAAEYFKKLADANVGGKPEYAVPYRFLAKHYLDKKDAANVNKYVTQGLALYPQDDYLPLVQFDMIRQSGDKAALFAEYEKMLAKNPNDYAMLVDYGNELFDIAHTMEEGKRPANYDELCTKIESLYAQAIKVKPESNEAKLNLSKHYYNMALRFDDEIKPIRTSTKAEDVTKRGQLQAKQLVIVDKAIPLMEGVFNELDAKSTLTRSEKSEYKSAANNLMYMYDKKKDKAKVDFYQKKYDAADSKG